MNGSVNIVKKSDYKGVWVFLELDGDGQLRDVGLELLTAARNVAAASGEKVSALLLGRDCRQAAEQASACGPDEVIVVEGEAYGEYSTDGYTHALAELISRRRPSALLIGATGNGRDLAPRLAGRLQTGLTADCIGVDYDEAQGCIAWLLPSFGGNLMAKILCPERRPQIGTVHPGVFDPPPPSPSAAAPIIREDIPLPQGTIRTRLLERIPREKGGDQSIGEAEVIVGVGRGLQKEENLRHPRALAEALGGTLGATRNAVDAGWMDSGRMIGQTGRNVKPRLYIACGVSGATHHMAGVSGAGTVVALNSDPKAPIFDMADYGIVGDVCELLPLLTKELQEEGGKP